MAIFIKLKIKFVFKGKKNYLTIVLLFINSFIFPVAFFKISIHAFSICEIFTFIFTGVEFALNLIFSVFLRRLEFLV